MTAPDLYWFRVRRILNRWHVLSSEGDRDFPTHQTACIFAATLSLRGYINADE
jgi:hypothetical protein